MKTARYIGIQEAYPPNKSFRLFVLLRTLEKEGEKTSVIDSSVSEETLNKFGIFPPKDMKKGEEY